MLCQIEYETSMIGSIRLFWTPFFFPKSHSFHHFRLPWPWNIWPVPLGWNLPSQIFRACHCSGALSATTQVPWQDSQRAQGPRTWCVGATPLPSRPHFERAPNRAMISYKGLYQWAKYSGKMTHLKCSYIIYQHLVGATLFWRLTNEDTKVLTKI